MHRNRIAAVAASVTLAGALVLAGGTSASALEQHLAKLPTKAECLSLKNHLTGLGYATSGDCGLDFTHKNYTFWYWK